MANGATIERSGGSLSAAPTFGATVNVEYTQHTANITTGPELPSTVSVLNNLTINTTNGVTLNAARTANGTFTLTNGILTTTANLLSIASAGTISGGSSTSYVDGPLRRTLPGSGPYTWPVGGSSYLPFTLSAVSGSSPVVTVQAFNVATGGTPLAPLVALSGAERWEATVDGGTYTDGSVSLARQSTLGSLNAIGRSDTEGGSYTSLGGTVSGNAVEDSDPTGNSLGVFRLAELVESEDCVAPNLNAKFDGEDAASICSGDDGELSAAVSSGANCAGVFEYAWYTGTGLDNTYWNGSTWDNAETWGAYATISGVEPSETTTYKVKVRCSLEVGCNNEDAVGVTVTVSQPPTTADAGTDQTQCSNGSFSLGGNSPVVGNGAWSVFAGTATITPPGTSPTSSINGVPAGSTATLRWTITSGGCTPSTSDVVLRNVAAPTVDAQFNGSNGPAVCAGTSGTLTANPSGGGACTGTFEYAWYTGDGNDETYWDGNDWDNAETWGAFASISDVEPAATTTYKVKVRCSTFTTCDNEDATGVIVTVNEAPTTALAGDDQTQCGNSAFTLAANTPSVGTGAWSVISGPGSVTTPASPTSGVTGVTVGSSLTLRWTISNAPCTASFDEVVLSNRFAPTVPSITPPSGAYCVSGSVNFAASATAAGPGQLTSPFVGGSLSKASGSGAWDTYPGTISVSGLDVTNSKVKRVSISNFNGQPGNVDMVLQSPTGTNVIIMADVGGIFSVSNRNYVFEDGAPSFSDASGTYRPSSGDGSNDNFPSPGPGNINQVSPALSNFTGNPNGTWQLFVVNDFGHAALISTWAITFEIPSLSYSWSPATGLSGTTGASVTASPSITTTYTVTVTNNQGGCTNTNTATVTVNPLPVVDAGSYATLCSVDADLTLVGDPAGGTWSGTGVTGDQFDPSVGTQTLTYEYTDGNGCTNSDEVTITVTPATTWYADQDADGFGDPATFIQNCNVSNPGYVLNNTDNCPTVFGLQGDYCDANPDPNAFGLGALNGSCACDLLPTDEDLILELRTPDGSSQQISWEIITPNNLVVCSGGGYGAGITAPITPDCSLPNGCFRLRVLDSTGDGFGVGGGYQLRLTGSPTADIRIIDNTGNFNTGTVSTISGGPNAFCFPMGEQKPIYTSREKLDWIAGQYIVAEADAAVSAQWLQGVSQTDDGYEFWFFDPNGGYSFRRFRNHATSDGFGNVGATRACHMKINNWAASSHIPANRLMNVRIRARVNGVNGLWGPVYRFKIDPVRAQCPLTKLNDIPNDVAESCNKSRLWGSGNWIWARPVSGANKYQFRFRLPAEGYNQVITSNTYFLQLNWTAVPGLEAGKTYQVDVRVSKNGGATWCATGLPWGDICTLSILEPDEVQGGGQEIGPQVSGNGNLVLWPNPNNGDHLWLNVDAIGANVETVTIDIYDLTGKRAMGRVLPTQGEQLNTVLDINGLSTGVYLVNITAGDKSWAQRLVIAQ
jgi:hypothetical protein